MVLTDHIRAALGGKWGDDRAQARAALDRLDLLADPSLSLDRARDRALDQMRRLAGTGIAAAGFRTDNGGLGDPGRAVTGIEVLAQFDLSLMVKAGVQWGLFGGAIENLGTQRHHDRYLRAIIDLDLLGCFAMTETGHGSDVQRLEVTATYDVDGGEFVIHSPTPSARKDYIGGAARHATVAAVFAQLISRGRAYGVHCFVVPIRAADGSSLPGVTISDCGHKGGLAGVDNGRLVFDHVRIPRDNLLDRYGSVAADGTYTSPIDDVDRRFFTMLGTLVRGRVSVGGAAAAAAQVALSIAGRYALRRTQFTGPADREVTLLDYRLHQRRLLPLVARAYAYQFAQNQLVARLHRLQTTAAPGAFAQRELESRAAGLKAVQTWHASHTIQACREACGGAGYMAENRLTTLRGDCDVFTTFEGDNHVLLQLVAKELLTAYAADVRGLDPVGMLRFVAASFTDVVKERTAAAQLIQRLIDARPGNEDSERNLLDRGGQLALFEDREQHVLETLARRLRRAGTDRARAFAAFNDAQDHVVRAGRVHIDRIVLEAFTAGIARCPDAEAQDLLRAVCDLYALSIIEDDKAWFLEHKRLTTARAKAVSSEINNLVARLRPHTLTLLDGFGVPAAALGAAMLAD